MISLDLEGLSFFDVRAALLTIVGVDHVVVLEGRVLVFASMAGGRHLCVFLIDRGGRKKEEETEEEKKENLVLPLLQRSVGFVEGCASWQATLMTTW